MGDITTRNNLHLQFACIFCASCQRVSIWSSAITLSLDGKPITVYLYLFRFCCSHLPQSLFFDVLWYSLSILCIGRIFGLNCFQKCSGVLQKLQCFQNGAQWLFILRLYTFYSLSTQICITTCADRFDIDWEKITKTTGFSRLFCLCTLVPLHFVDLMYFHMPRFYHCTLYDNLVNASLFTILFSLNMFKFSLCLNRVNSYSCCERNHGR